MTQVVAVDAEDVVKAWLLTTSVAPLVTWSGKTHVYLGMPKGNPLPSVILSRVGGSPRMDSDVSEDIARIGFRIYGNDRNTVKEIAKSLVSEVESVAYSPEFTMLHPIEDVVMGRLSAAHVINWLWSPDPVSDTPRYLVDVLCTVRN